MNQLLPIIRRVRRPLLAQAEPVQTNVEVTKPAVAEVATSPIAVRSDQDEPGDSSGCISASSNPTPVPSTRSPSE